MKDPDLNFRAILGREDKISNTEPESHTSTIGSFLIQSKHPIVI